MSIFKAYDIRGTYPDQIDEKIAYLDDEYHAMKRSAGCLMCPDWIPFVSSVEESKRVTASTEPCIVIAASGMCEHGRILHHLKQGIGDPRNSVVIVGFQAGHTLGRRLVEGETEVRIFGDLLPRRAEVAVLDAFSAHAGRSELIDYVRALRPPRTSLVHGEPEGIGIVFQQQCSDCETVFPHGEVKRLAVAVVTTH